MKRFYLAVVVALIIAWGALPSTTQEKRPRQDSRIGFANVGLVIQKCRKAKDFETERSELLAPGRKQGATLSLEILNLKKSLAAPDITPVATAKLEQALLEAKRRLEDLDGEFRKQMTKLIEKQTMELFKDLQQASSQLAVKHQFTAILTYGDVEKKDQPWFSDIDRIMDGMNKSSLYPMYVDPEFDVTQRLLDTVDQNYLRSPPKKAGGAGGL